MTAQPVVKPVDGFFTTFFVSPFSVRVARGMGKTGLRPDQVTWFAMALGVGAAAAFATGDRLGFVGGAFLAYLAFFFDCVDGQLARLTGQTSARGAYLDGMLDRAKEYVIFAGLAIGAAPDAWILGCAALALQTTRHAVDFSSRPPADAPRATGLTWLKRIAAFPIGERFAVIALITALTTPETTFVVLLAAGALALAYVAAGRLRRGQTEWVVPALQRAVELGVLAVAAGFAGASAAAFWVLFGLAMWRYHQVLR